MATNWRVLEDKLEAMSVHELCELLDDGRSTHAEQAVALIMLCCGEPETENRGGRGG